MKLFLGHYIYIPSHGFIKQYVVEVSNEGYVTSIFPLTIEEESIIWTPGVIALLPVDAVSKPYDAKSLGLFFDSSTILHDASLSSLRDVSSSPLVAVRFYPFDYDNMRPTDGVYCQQLF